MWMHFQVSVFWSSSLCCCESMATMASHFDPQWTWKHTSPTAQITSNHCWTALFKNRWQSVIPPPLWWNLDCHCHHAFTTMLAANKNAIQGPTENLCGVCTSIIYFMAQCKLHPCLWDLSTECWCSPALGTNRPLVCLSSMLPTDWVIQWMSKPINLLCVSSAHSHRCSAVLVTAWWRFTYCTLDCWEPNLYCSRVDCHGTVLCGCHARALVCLFGIDAVSHLFLNDATHTMLVLTMFHTAKSCCNITVK